MEMLKVIRNNGTVILVDMVSCQKKILNQSEYENKTDEEIIKHYKTFCIKSENRKA